MMSFNKSLRTFLGLRHVYIAACRIPMRLFSDHEDDGQAKYCKQSAVAKLADCGVRSGTTATPEAVSLSVDVRVRPRINELDQRKQRRKALNEEIIKPSLSYTLQQRLPFKMPKPNANGNFRQALGHCLSEKQVLQLTDKPERLAHELVKLVAELNAEKRRNEEMLESFQQLQQKVLLKN